MQPAGLRRLAEALWPHIVGMWHDHPLVFLAVAIPVLFVSWQILCLVVKAESTPNWRPHEVYEPPVFEDDAATHRPSPHA